MVREAPAGSVVVLPVVFKGEANEDAATSIERNVGTQTVEEEILDGNNS